MSPGPFTPIYIPTPAKPAFTPMPGPRPLASTGQNALAPQPKKTPDFFSAMTELNRSFSSIIHTPPAQMGPAQILTPKKQTERSDKLPADILKILLQPFFFHTQKKEDAISPTAALSIVDREGMLEISTKYQKSYAAGQEALLAITNNLELAASMEDPLDKQIYLEGALEQLKTFEASARDIKDVHTRKGINAYASIETWSKALYDLRQAFEFKNGLMHGKQSVSLNGTMLGFNLTNINNIDATYRTGTAVKLLIEQKGREVAEKMGAQGLGILDNNSLFIGVKKEDVAKFRAEVLKEVVTFLKTDQPLPENISDTIGLKGLSTKDLPSRHALIKDTKLIGLTVSFQEAQIEMKLIETGVEADIIKVLNKLAQGESTLRKSGQEVFIGEISTQLSGRGIKPLLKTGSLLTLGTAPHDVTPLEVSEIKENQSLPTVEDIKAGRLPRPTHDSGHSIKQAETLKDLIQKAIETCTTDPAKATAQIEEMKNYMQNPEGRPESFQIKTIKDFYQKGFGDSLQDLRFEGVFRLDVFSQVTSQHFQGKKFYVQLAEYKDYWGHNNTHIADAGDSMHRLTMDLLVKGYQYHGLDVLVGTQGGDEVYFAFSGQNEKGEDLKPKDIARISDYLTTNFNNTFKAIIHQEVTKIPMMDGGRFLGKNYLVKDDVVYIEKKSFSADQTPELLETIRTAHGKNYQESQIKEVDSLSKMATVERLQLWQRVDTKTGKIIEIFKPLGQAPDGFQPVNIPLSTTITSAMEIPAGSEPALVKLALEHTGEQASQMKKQGFDRPAVDGKKGPPPVIKFNLADHLQTSHAARAIFGGWMYAVGEVGSESLVNPSRLASSEFYSQVAMTFIPMSLGSSIGQDAAEKGLALLSKNTRMQSFLSAEYKGMSTKGMITHGGSLFGAMILTELVASRPIDAKEMAINGGIILGASAISTLQTWAVTQSLRGTGLLPAASKAPVPGPVKLGLATAAVISESLIMKWVGDYRSQSAMDEHEGELRAEMTQAMKELDQTVDTVVFVNVDGSVDEVAKEKYRSALVGLEQSYGDLLMFRFARTLPQGTAYLKAQQTYGQASQKVEQLYEKYGILEKIKANPSNETALVEEAVRKLEEVETARSLLGGGAIGEDPIQDFRDSIVYREETKSAMNTAQGKFEKNVSDILQKTEPKLGLEVPFFAAPKTINDPVELYQQLCSYLPSRIARAEEKQIEAAQAVELTEQFFESLSGLLK